MYCYEWGMGLYDAGKYDAAVVAYDLAIQRDNTSPETFNNRAFALRELGRLQEASQSFAEAARLAPESAKYFVRWGMVLVEGKQHQDAVKILSKAIELDPRYRRAYELRAEAYEALGESNLAAADERRAAALESD
jgi:Tfp pilus assembly protein PilF